MGKFAHFSFVAPDLRTFPADKHMDLAALIETTVTGLGYELVDVERSNRSKLLRVFIDLTPAQAAQRQGKKKTGAMINVDDCEAVSRQLTYAFNVENIDYDRLEVSSPGLDRPLKKPGDFERFAGLEVTVKLRSAPGGAFGVRKNFQGIARFVDGKPALEFEGQMLELDFAQIDKARLVPKYEF
jgi:ribosome maturation factor RimP